MTLKLSANPLTTPTEHFQIRGGHYVQRQKEKLKAKRRALSRRFIKADNAAWIADVLPTAGEIVHGITPGNFVFGDFIAAIVKAKGPPRRLTCSTLSMSEHNAKSLAAILTAAPKLTLTLLLSTYFEKTSQQIYAAAMRELEPFEDRLITITARIHTKLTLLDYAAAAYVIEGSANLRSSDNIEQLTISNCRGLLDFHQQWIGELRQAT